MAAPSAITARPVLVEPVNDTMSTLGSFDSNAPTPWSLAVTMLTTPAGKSVCSAISSPSTAAAHGVSGAGLSTNVFPAARAGPIFARLICCGKFHGVMAPTTPIASRAMVRWVLMPIGEAIPRSLVH